MKKTVCLLTILISTFVLAACCLGSAVSDSQISLCDIRNHTADELIFELSEEELKSVMAARFSALDSDLDADEINDPDVKVFNCKSVFEFQKQIINEIVSHRLVEDYYNYLIEHSYAETNKETDDFVDNVINACEISANRQNISVDTFLIEYYQMDLQSFTDYLSDLWVNMQIVFAYCDNHNISCSEMEINDMEMEILDSDEFQVLFENGIIRRKIVRYMVLSDKIQAAIKTDFADEIEQYADRIIANLGIGP